MPCSRNAYPQPVRFDQAPDLKVSQMEANFSLFFPTAIQLYESTLVLDDTLSTDTLPAVATQSRSSKSMA